MVNKKDAEKKEKTSSQGKVKSKIEEKKEVHFCKDCKWYDKNTEREFHRKVGPKNEKGERSEIIEVRAICRNKNSNAYNHLVMTEYDKRQCPVWERGVYVKPVEEQKKDEIKSKKSAITKLDNEADSTSDADLVKT